MALTTPSQSPAIVTKEIDLTGGVPNVPTSTGAFVGEFRWGPVQQPTLVANEAGLVERFGSPDSDNTVEWHSAAYFLRYSSDLSVVREINGAVNGWDSDAGGSGTAAAPVVKNRDNWDNQIGALKDSDHTFVSKWPGELGNSLEVQFCTADSSGTTDFDAWAYKGAFDAAPDTTAWDSARGSSKDEIHIAVIDAGGLFTGVKNSVLETFPFLSLSTDNKSSDGATNFVKNVVNNASEYVWMAGFGTSHTTPPFSASAGTASTIAKNKAKTGTVTGSMRMANGSDGSALTTSEYATGFDEYEDVDTTLVDFLIAPGMNSQVDQTAVVNDLVAIAQGTRKDCVVVTSPNRAAIINNANPVTAAVTTANTFTSSSYLIVDNNYLKVYDKFTDQYIFIPASSSTAGIMAATDYNAAPWFSPAGPRRGQYLGITALAYSPKKTDRDTLYKAGVNPIANIPGQGVLLFGDKTKLARPSAFDRINVRRLFLGLERAIAIAARNVMFEFNDEFTRAEFKNIIEPFLREIQGRRGITDFQVICDDTNNTPAVIDRNEFICSIFIKPARSINYVTLNFVAVRTGVEFSEVVGTV